MGAECGVSEFVEVCMRVDKLMTFIKIFLRIVSNDFHWSFIVFL